MRGVLDGMSGLTSDSNANNLVTTNVPSGLSNSSGSEYAVNSALSAIPWASPAPKVYFLVSLSNRMG